MEKMKDLKDLLIHEIEDLYSAEEQIIEALPLMIKKAKDGKLVTALKDHLKVTEQQKARLDEVKQLLIGDSDENNSEQGGQKGFFGGFFGTSGKKNECIGMKGLIEEGQKVMAEDMSPKVLDAAIIASAQKIEHYEICGYGTARAYARELNLGQVAERLEETLDEEYEADDLLTDLAVGGLNEEAEIGGLRRTGSRSGKSSRSKGNGSKQANATKKSAPKKASTAQGSSKASLRTNKKSSASGNRAKTSGSKGKSGSSGGSKSRGR